MPVMDGSCNGKNCRTASKKEVGLVKNFMVDFSARKDCKEFEKGKILCPAQVAILRAKSECYPTPKTGNKIPKSANLSTTYTKLYKSFQ